MNYKQAKHTVLKSAARRGLSIKAPEAALLGEVSRITNNFQRQVKRDGAQAFGRNEAYALSKQIRRLMAMLPPRVESYRLESISHKLLRFAKDVNTLPDNSRFVRLSSIYSDMRDFLKWLTRELGRGR